MAGQEIPPCGGAIGNETSVSRIQSPEDQSEEHLRRRKSKFKVPEMGLACNVQGTERRTLFSICEEGESNKWEQQASYQGEVCGQ